MRLTSEDDGFVIGRIALSLSATVPGTDEARFHAIALSAKRDCPLSKALASGAGITLLASLQTDVPRVAA